jgi:hypothetical protein
MTDALILRRFLQAISLIDCLAVIVTLSGALWAVFADSDVWAGLQPPAGWWLVLWVQGMAWLAVRTTARIRSIHESQNDENAPGGEAEGAA